MITHHDTAAAFDQNLNGRFQLFAVTGNITGTKDHFNGFVSEDSEGVLQRGQSRMHIADQTYFHALTLHWGQSRYGDSILFKVGC